MAGLTWTKAELDVIRRHADVMTSQQIAALLHGRSADGVKKQAAKMKISLRKYGERCSWAKYSDAATERARILHEQGHSIKEIEQALQIPRHALHSIIYYKRGLGYGY